MQNTDNPRFLTAKKAAFAKYRSIVSAPLACLITTSGRTSSEPRGSMLWKLAGFPIGSSAAPVFLDTLEDAGNLLMGIMLDISELNEPNKIIINSLAERVACARVVIDEAENLANSIVRPEKQPRHSFDNYNAMACAACSLGDSRVSTATALLEKLYAAACAVDEIIKAISF